jgi:hypothetical protein
MGQLTLGKGRQGWVFAAMYKEPPFQGVVFFLFLQNKFMHALNILTCSVCVLD